MQVRLKYCFIILLAAVLAFNYFQRGKIKSEYKNTPAEPSEEAQAPKRGAVPAITPEAGLLKASFRYVADKPEPLKPLKGIDDDRIEQEQRILIRAASKAKKDLTLSTPGPDSNS